MKRSSSLQDADEDMSSSALHLKAQNRSLSVEILRYKRQLTDARKELDLIRGKSREMESLVSIIQRAWSQLDIDVSMLLDGFGDSEPLIEGAGNTELLHRLVHAGSDFHVRDPTDVTGLPQLDVDEWSTAEDIEKARALTVSRLLRLGAPKEGVTVVDPPPSSSSAATAVASSSSSSAPSSSSSSSSGRHGGSKSKKETDAADEEEYPLSPGDVGYGGKVEEALGAHAAFTVTLLERLCIILNDTGVADQLPESIGAIADARALHAEIFVLKDRITTLSKAIVGLQTRLVACETQRKAAERAMDRNAAAAAAAAAEVVSAAVAGTTDGQAGRPPRSASAMDVDAAAEPGAAEVAPATDEGAGAPSAAAAAEVAIDPEVEEALRWKIEVLEKQLAESETAKARAEMTLTERLARPLSQTEAQVADMRRAMDDLRHQGRQRVAALITEGIALQDRVADLDAALVQVEAMGKAKCGEISAATAAEVQRVEGEKKAVETALFSARAELAMTNQLKQQLGDLQTREAAARTECHRLQQQLGVLTARQAKMQQHLAAARSREDALEQQWSSQPPPPGSDSDSGGDERKRLALAHAQARARETQIELDDARALMNDLINEIDAVTVEAGKSREQSERLLRQMTESQSMQRGVLDENLRLHEQIADMQRRTVDVDDRVDTLQGQIKAQDAVISQLRAVETAVRGEIHGFRKLQSDEHSQRILNEQLVVEAEQKLKLTEHSMELGKKRNAELQARCDELAAQAEVERRARQTAEREARPKVPKRERKDDVKGGDADMLDMTLGMLRCSVCKDRFKDCAITRCFHLFCKECIEENLRNRHRKCPACGEKFGADDVQRVYFTH